MACCTASVYEPSPWPPNSATFERLPGHGIHPSTYYCWKQQLDRHGLDILRPRERRPLRMANATSPLVQLRVDALTLGHPGFGPARIAAELAQPSWGVGSPCRPIWCGGCYAPRAYPRVPRDTGWWLATPPLERPQPSPQRHLQVDHSGQLVQLDCLSIGPLDPIP